MLPTRPVVPLDDFFDSLVLFPWEFLRGLFFFTLVHLFLGPQILVHAVGNVRVLGDFL
jgi:hypothetical protein